MDNHTSTDDCLRVIRELHSQTAAGTARWEATGEDGAFRSVRARAAAFLDLAGTPPRARLRFTATDGSSDEIIIGQPPGSELGSRRQQEMEHLLTKLWQFVRMQVYTPSNAADLFLLDPPAQPS